METLKEKCDKMRSTTDYRLETDSYVMVMIDGKNFSNKIKKRYKRPFDDTFINMMNEVAKYVCKKVQGCKFAYTQSDEITFVIEKDEDSTPYFQYRLSKLLSIIPSMATAKFTHMQVMNMLETPCSISDMKQIIRDIPLIEFDCKAWVANTFNDVYSFLLFRQNDCIRNSKQQAAQSYIPHRELLNKNCDEQILMLLEKKNIDWNEYSDGVKYGRYIYKENVEMKTEEGEPFFRSKWLEHNAFPLHNNDGKQKLIDLNVISLKK